MDKQKVVEICKLLQDKELLSDLVKIYKSEGQPVIDSIHNLAVSDNIKGCRNLITAIVKTLATPVSKTIHYEYWDLTLEDIRNKTELSKKYPDIDEAEWYRINNNI